MKSPFKALRPPGAFLRGVQPYDTSSGHNWIVLVCAGICGVVKWFVSWALDPFKAHHLYVNIVYKFSPTTHPAVNGYLVYAGVKIVSLNNSVHRKVKNL